MACKEYYLYKHTTPNGKIYIGITRQELRLRWANGHGYKHCKHFFNAILKYGWDNIQHEVLFENLSRKEAETLEIEYIKKYKSDNRQCGYNMCSGGFTPEISDETRLNMSTIKSGNNKGKPILVYNLNNEYIGEFISSYQAAKILSCDQGHIRKCCNQQENRKQHRGFIFKYK